MAQGSWRASTGTGLTTTSIVNLNGGTALTAPAPDDLFPIVDVSDTSEHASGTVKKVTLDTLFSTAETITVNAMGALAIDVTKKLNSKSISADQTFTFSATPTTGTDFALRLKNTDTASHVATIPTSQPEGTATTITTVTIPPSCTIFLGWHYDGSVYHLFGTQYAGKHMIPVMAGAMRPSVTGGCAALTAIASAANQPDIVTLDFDASTEEYAQFSIPMPESWDEGTLTFCPIWSHAAAATFVAIWALQAVAVSNDDGIAVAFGTAVTSTDTGGTTNDVYIGPESSAMTVAGTPAAGDMVFFRVYRDADAGGDTLNVDARLHGIRLYFTSNSETDA